MGTLSYFARHCLLSCLFSVSVIFNTMLDLITLISTMGVQQELADTQDKRITIRETEGESEDLVAQAADSLSSAFESLETLSPKVLGQCLALQSQNQPSQRQWTKAGQTEMCHVRTSVPPMYSVI